MILGDFEALVLILALSLCLTRSIDDYASSKFLFLRVVLHSINQAHSFETLRRPCFLGKRQSAILIF